MNFEVNGIFGLLLLILDIWAIIQVAQSSASPLKKALWIVAILLLPLLGVIVWYFFGPRK